MGVFVVATAQSDGSHMVNISLIITVSFSLLILSRSTTHHREEDIKDISIGAKGMDLRLDIKVL
jgi:hypothetical protein